MITVLFDIDGTLLASGGAGKAALEAAFSEDFGLPVKVQVPYSGRTDRAIARDLFLAHDLPHTMENWEKLLAGYLRRLPDSLERHQGRVLPGIAELLQALQDRPNMHVGLLTGNVRAGARVKLGHFGLFDHFAFGGFGDLHFDRDDVAREALGEVQRRVGTHSDRIWIVGDTPLDVQCARAIGARAVAVATGFHTIDQLAATKPDLLLLDLSDPEPLLQALTAT